MTFRPERALKGFPEKKNLKNQLKAGSQPASSEFFLLKMYIWGINLLESIARFSHVSVVILRVVVFLGS